MGGKGQVRVPRLGRLEYLAELLHGIADGYDPDDVRRRTQRIRDEFEAQKAMALGRKQPRPAGGDVVAEAERAAVHLGLAAHDGAVWKLTLDGQVLLNACAADERGILGNEARRLLVPRFWQAYPFFGQTLLSMRAQPQQLVELPMRSGEGAFRDALEGRYGLAFDIVTFSQLREFGTQLGLVNWHVVESERPRRQRVYLVADIVLLKEVTPAVGAGTPPNELWLDLAKATTPTEPDADPVTPCDVGGLRSLAHARGDIVVDTNSDCAIIRPHDALDVGEFEQTLWEVYLAKTKLRTHMPVLYPELRNEVCLRMRIPDRLFDQVALNLMTYPQRIRLDPSGGELGYASNLAHLHKYLTPQFQGHNVTYLKVSDIPLAERRASPAAEPAAFDVGDPRNQETAS